VNPPSVLLDHSFLVAIGDPDNADHEEAVARYHTLVDDFVAQRCLLVARADHLPAGDNRDLFSPIDKLHVARQHRNAATELVARTGIAIDEAITLVLLHRLRIRKVASFNQRFAEYDSDRKVAIPPNVVAAESLDDLPATKLVPEAG
jgi:predicted nucleic acid-binding protein